MNWWQALILGIVEGITEYLPVSSTGHLIIVAAFLGLSKDAETWAATNTFNIVIQSGAIIAVLGLYWPRVKQMILGALGKDAAGLKLLINLLIAFLPAAVLGPLLDDRIEAHLFRVWPVVGALFVGAWLMLAVAYSRKLQHNVHKGLGIESVTWKIALLIGFGQCIAMWPGTSRSMMTIVAALMLGMRPRAAAEFSFLLGLITLSAATGYKFVFSGSEMIESFRQSGENPWVVVGVGLVASTVSAALAVKWFVAFLTRKGLAPFGWYRLAIAGVLTVLILAGYVTLPEVGETSGVDSPAAQEVQP